LLVSLERSDSKQINKSDGDESSRRSEEQTHMAGLRIITDLGSGSFSTVKLGVDSSSGKEYAVKIFSKKQLKSLFRIRRLQEGGLDDDTAISSVYNEMHIVRGLLARRPCKSLLSVHRVVEIDTNDSIVFIMDFMNAGASMCVSEGGGYMIPDVLLKLLSDVSGTDADVARDNISTVRGSKRVYTEAFLAQLMKQLIVGVAHMHDCGVCHRDIKPDNLLLHVSGAGALATEATLGDGCAPGDIYMSRVTLKISDFGCARELHVGSSSVRDRIANMVADREATMEDNVTTTTTTTTVTTSSNSPCTHANSHFNPHGLVNDTAGTPAFWPPEALDPYAYPAATTMGLDMDGNGDENGDNNNVMLSNGDAHSYAAYPADIWATGVTMFCFLHGDVPFTGLEDTTDVESIFDYILYNEPIYADGLSGQAMNLLEATLRKDPMERPSSLQLQEMIISWYT